GLAAWPTMQKAVIALIGALQSKQDVDFRNNVPLRGTGAQRFALQCSDASYRDAVIKNTEAGSSNRSPRMRSARRRPFSGLCALSRKSAQALSFRNQPARA